MKTTLPKISKLLFSLFFSFFIFLISSSGASASDISCDWSFNKESNKLTFCGGNFPSESDAIDHHMEFSCTKNCGFLGRVNSVQPFNITAAASSGDGKWFSCATMGGFSNDVYERVEWCMNDGGTKAECIPNFQGQIRKRNFGLFRTTQCTAALDKGVFYTLEEAKIEAEGGDGLINPRTIEVTSEVLDSLNPLKIEGSSEAEALSTPGGIISKVLDFAFPIAGLILFVMLVFGGFGMVAGATNKKALEASQQRMTSAIVGFILLFSSFWIMRLIEMIFGLKIL